MRKSHIFIVICILGADGFNIFSGENQFASTEIPAAHVLPVLFPNEPTSVAIAIEKFCKIIPSVSAEHVEIFISSELCNVKTKTFAHDKYNDQMENISVHNWIVFFANENNIALKATEYGILLSKNVTQQIVDRQNMHSYASFITVEKLPDKYTEISYDSDKKAVFIDKMFFNDIDLFSKYLSGVTTDKAICFFADKRASKEEEPILNILIRYSQDNNVDLYIHKGRSSSVHPNIYKINVNK